jgi:hypothetical protein
LKKLANYIAG